MLLQLRVRPRTPPPSETPEPALAALGTLAADAGVPLSLRHVNALPDGVRMRLCRLLLPADLLARHDIDPVTWLRRDKSPGVSLQVGRGELLISAKKRADDPDDFIVLELHDNDLNGIDLNLLLLNDPDSPYYRTDYDAEGRLTQFGTVSRNLPEEERAMAAGLAPGQVRNSQGGSRLVLAQFEQALVAMGQRAYFVEPLTYASAWVFERRGFAYVRGHKLMDDIHAGFQPGGALFATLDGSTPFRQPAQAHTVRGRAWAIHDGVLAAIDETWNDLRMVKQVGRAAHVSTAPDAEY